MSILLIQISDKGGRYTRKECSLRQYMSGEHKISALSC